MTAVAAINSPALSSIVTGLRGLNGRLKVGQAWVVLNQARVHV
jgi:hypothetical protein